MGSGGRGQAKQGRADPLRALGLSPTRTGTLQVMLSSSIWVLKTALRLWCGKVAGRKQGPVRRVSFWAGQEKLHPQGLCTCCASGLAPSSP